MGQRIREIRKKHNLTQTEFGSRLNVVKSTVSQWEKGINEPDRDTLTQIAEIFGVTVDWLFGLPESPQHTPVEEKGITLEEFKKIVESGAPLREGEPLSEEKRKQLLTLLEMFIEQEKQK